VADGLANDLGFESHWRECYDAIEGWSIWKSLSWKSLSAETTITASCTVDDEGGRVIASVLEVKKEIPV
jgi:hypothetical protein